MKFFEATVSLLAVLPAVVSAATVRRDVDDDARRGRGGFGGNSNSGNNHGSGASSAAATISAATNAAAASATSTSSNTGSNSNSGSDSADAQTSLTLNPAVIATGFEQNGQENATAGQVPSATSSNNFINFCLTVNKPLTNGTQITGGSCNPAPMGQIASTANMPSAKFAFPTNGAVIAPNTAFTVLMNINNLDTGFFVNADLNYFAAPQVCGSDGNIQGHSHVVIEALDSVTQTTPTDPSTFAFFKGLDDPAVNGQLNADVTAGLPAGAYRIASINTAANHQPVLVAIAQHGTLDDMVYFTVSDDASSSSGSGAASSSSVAASTSVAASPASSKAASPASSKAPAASATATSSKNTGSNQNNGNGQPPKSSNNQPPQNNNNQQQQQQHHRRLLNRAVFA